MKSVSTLDVQSFLLNQLNQLSSCGFQSVMLRNSRLFIIFQGGPFTTTTRLRIPDKLYKELMRREVINRSIDQHNQFCQPIRELHLTPVFVFPGELPAALHQRQYGADLQSVSPWQHVGGWLGRRKDKQLPGEHQQADCGAQ